DTGRGHTAEDDPLHLPLERLVKDRHPRRVRGRLREEVEREVVARRRDAAVPALQQAHREIAVVGPEEVPRVGVALYSRARGYVVVETLLAGRGDPQVSGKDVPGDRVVGVPLDVRVA